MALISCPECGKRISGMAEVCIHCGYPLSKHPQEEEEPAAEAAAETEEPEKGQEPEEGLEQEEGPEPSFDGEVEKPAKKGTARNYNARLAITAFIAMAGSAVLNTLNTQIIGGLGVYALAGMTRSGGLVSLLNRVLIILLVIAFFKPWKVLNYIAIGYEATAAILMTAIPGALAAAYGGPSDTINAMSDCLRMTGILWLLMCGLCVLLGFVIRRRKMMLYFIIFGGVYLMIPIMTAVFVPLLGAKGTVFSNMIQPFQYILPLLLFNPDRDS